MDQKNKEKESEAGREERNAQLGELEGERGSLLVSCLCVCFPTRPGRFNRFTVKCCLILTYIEHQETLFHNFVLTNIK